MILTYNLNWSKHIRDTTMRASRKLGIFRRQSCKFLRSKLEKIYLCMIRPALEYGCVIFDNCSAANSLSLEGIQRRVAVICTGALRCTESLKLEKETGWESRSLRGTKAKLLLYFSFCSGNAPLYLQGKIQFAGNLCVTLGLLKSLIIL